MEHSLHGALPVRGPANAGRARDLVLDGPPALPEVHLMVIVNKEECCEGKTDQTIRGFSMMLPVTLPQT